MFDMLCLPEMIQQGLWIGEKDRSACVLHFHPETGRQYKGAIKAAAEGYETYITAFHRVKARQRKSILKRGAILT